MTSAVQRFGLWALDKNVLSPITGRTNLGNTLFKIVSGLVVLGSALEEIPLFYREFP